MHQWPHKHKSCYILLLSDERPAASDLNLDVCTIIKTRHIIYVQHDTAALSRNHFCHGNATALSLYCCDCQQKYYVLHKMPLWRIYVSGNTKMYLRPHVKYLIFLPDFNQICTFSTDFHSSPQNQISRKSFHWKLRWYKRTNGQPDMTNVTGGFHDYAKALRTN